MSYLSTRCHIFISEKNKNSALYTLLHNITSFIKFKKNIKINQNKIIKNFSLLVDLKSWTFSSKDFIWINKQNGK